MRNAGVRGVAPSGILAGARGEAVLRRRPAPRDALDGAAIELLARHADRPVGSRVRRPLAARARLRPAKEVRATEKRPRHQNGKMQAAQEWRR